MTSERGGVVLVFQRAGETPGRELGAVQQQQQQQQQPDPRHSSAGIIPDETTIQTYDGRPQKTHRFHNRHS